MVPLGVQFEGSEARAGFEGDENVVVSGEFARGSGEDRGVSSASRDMMGASVCESTEVRAISKHVERFVSSSSLLGSRTKRKEHRVQ